MQAQVDGGSELPGEDPGLEPDSPVAQDALGAYLKNLRRYPLLAREDERRLAIRFVEEGDLAAAGRLITANLRLVVKLAQGYRKAHRNLLDLIQEGNVGLVLAVRKYDPYRGVKLSSYAAWWIRAYILKFILSNWRLVKIGTTQAQRKLFFNLRKQRARLEREGYKVEARHVAAALDISEKDVVEMEHRLGSSECSLDAPVAGRAQDRASRLNGDFVAASPAWRPDAQVEKAEFHGLLCDKLHRFESTLAGRDRSIFHERLLNESPATLQSIGESLGVSRERVRQMEERLKRKLRVYLESELGEAAYTSDIAEQPGPVQLAG